MPIVDRLRFWIRALFARRHVERDLDREMRFHLDMEIEQHVRDGMRLDDARRAALVAFGGVDRHKEAVRDERGTQFIEELVSDVKLAVRSFRARPVFAATAAITMGIGIGATTAVFSIANGLLFRPVPGVLTPQRVARIDLHHESGDSSRRTMSPLNISYPNLLDLERQTPALVGLAATAHVYLQFSVPGAAARSVTGSAVVGDYFGLLGVRPELGRLFDVEERLATQPVQVVVISDRLWRSAFDASPTAVGRVVRMNGSVFRVIGVASSGFLGIDRGGDDDLWVPGAEYQELRHDASLALLDRKRSLFGEMFGRLTPDATPSLAQMQIRAALARMVAEYPETNENFKVGRAYVPTDLGLIDYWRRPIVETIELLGIVATIVLLISCANTANLLLLRGIHRRSELGVRRALGASIGRLLRQQLAEGATLAVLGCAAGVIITLGFRFMLGEQSIGGLTPVGQLPIDWRELAFALVLSIGAGLAFSLAPALISSRSDLIASLADSTRATAGRTVRIRDGLSVIQIAAAMSLVVCGILLARTLRSLNRVDLGFDAAHTSAFAVDPSPQGYDAAHIRDFRDRLEATLRSRQSIDDVALASSAPFLGGMFRVDLRPAGHAGSDWPVHASALNVEPTFFATLRIPVLVGATFSADNVLADSTAPDHVVISRLLAQQLFGAANPIGKSITERVYRGTLTHVVTGVVGDIRASDLRGDVSPMLYSSTEHTRGLGSIVVVHSTAAPDEVERTVRRAVTAVDPAVPVARSWLISATVSRSIAAERLFARLVTTLALIGATLAAAGLYGIIAYSVAERTREIGIRMALGAPVLALIRLVTNRVLGMVFLGLALGTVASVWLSHLLASKLFGVTPLDPPSYALGAIVLIVLGLLAAASPARTATRVNPVDALRHE